MYYVYCKIVLTIAIAMRTATGFVGWYWHIIMPEYVPCTMVKYDDVVQEIGGAKFPIMSEKVAYTIDKY